jgi:ribonuclease D
MLGQFLSSALNSICRDVQVATSLVGNPTDVRDLIWHRLRKHAPADEAPRLTQGWRAEVIGKALDDLLTGRTTIRIRDPRSEQPLAFEPHTGDGRVDGRQ